MNNKIKSIVAITTIFGWPILGFKRGLNSYDYNYSNNKIYNNSTTPTRPLYIDKIAWGIGGVIFYLSPVGVFIGLYKEVYRLEVNLRGLEDEKKTDYYNKVM